MSTNTDTVSVRQARTQLKETRKLLKRAGKRLSDDVAAEVRAALDTLEGTLGGDDAEARTAASDELAAVADKRLAFARKSPGREYIEAIALAVFVALFIRAVIFEFYKIPSTSMVPTLLVGDKLFVEKFAYGVRIPFTTRYIARWGELDYGDTVVFTFPREHAVTRTRMGQLMVSIEGQDSPPASAELSSAGGQLPTDAWGTQLRYTLDGDRWDLRSAGPDKEFDNSDDITSEQVEASFMRPWGETTRGTPCPIDEASLTQRNRTYIKRVIGLPGDSIELRRNTLYINGEEAEQSEQSSRTEDRGGMGVVARYATETLPNGSSHLIRYFDTERSFGPLEVPEGHYLMLGDNRDDSSDGRCWGFTPEGHVKGRAKFVVITSAPTDRSFPASVFWRTGSIR